MGCSKKGRVQQQLGLGSWKNHGPWKLEKSRALEVGKITGWIEDDASNSYGRLFLPGPTTGGLLGAVWCFHDPKVFVARCPWAQAAAPSSALSLPKRNLGKGRISGDLFYIDQSQKICICKFTHAHTHTRIYSMCIYIYIHTRRPTLWPVLNRFNFQSFFSCSGLRYSRTDLA